MHIRCERCATLYELDERVLPPAGAPVQCTRCQHVFDAFPPPPAARAGQAPPSPDPIPARQSITDTPAGLASPVRSRSPWRWLAPVLVAVAAGAGYGTHAWRARQVAPAAVAKLDVGLALLVRDDAASLESAAASFAEACRLDPRLLDGCADAALARVLIAAGLREDATALEARVRSFEAERLRIEAERPAGWEEAAADAVAGMEAARAELAPLLGRAAALRDEAYADLRGLARAHAADLPVQRALAVYYALDGDAEGTGKLAGNARAARPADAWIELAEAAAHLTGASARGGRDEALARLELLAAAHPELLRARMLLAAADVDMGRRDAAVAALDSVLAANPVHGRARRMKAEILGLPPARPVEVAVPDGPPPQRRPGFLPRKSVEAR